MQHTLPEVDAEDRLAAADVPLPVVTASQRLEQARQFDSLVRRVYTPLTKYFSRRGLSMADCEDLTQLVLIRVLNKMRASPDQITDGYIFVAANSVFVDHCRSLRTRKGAETFELDPEIPAGDASAEKILEDRQTLNVIINVMRGMRPKQRRAFELHRFELLSYGQIAMRMGASVSSVEKYVMAALNELRRAVQGGRHD